MTARSAGLVASANRPANAASRGPLHQYDERRRRESTAASVTPVRTFYLGRRRVTEPYTFTGGRSMHTPVHLWRRSALFAVMAAGAVAASSILGSARAAADVDAARAYRQVNLVSDISGVAAVTDPNLV